MKVGPSVAAAQRITAAGSIGSAGTPNDHVLIARSRALSSIEWWWWAEFTVIDAGAYPARLDAAVRAGDVGLGPLQHPWPVGRRKRRTQVRSGRCWPGRRPRDMSYSANADVDQTGRGIAAERVQFEEPTEP